MACLTVSNTGLKAKYSKIHQNYAVTQDFNKTINNKVYCAIAQQFGNIAISAGRCVFPAELT